MTLSLFKPDTLKRYLPQSLALLFIVGFLTPPLGYGEKLLFAFDFLSALLFSWIISVSFFSRDKEPFRKLNAFFIASGMAFLFFYFIGFFRPALVPLLNQAFLDVGGFVFLKKDTFDFIQDGIQASRFYIWMNLCVSVFTLLRADQKLCKRAVSLFEVVVPLFLFILLVIFTLMKFNPTIELSIGHLYGYRPEDKGDLWVGRMRGPFQSPLEACFAVVFLTYSMIAFFKNSKLVRFSAFCAAFFIIYLTRTLTPLVAAGIAAFFFFCESYLKVKFNKKSLLLLIGVLLALFVACYFSPIASLAEFTRFKLANLLWRFKLWDVYFLTMLHHPLHLLFGFGFIALHADSSYVFILSRVGLFGIFLLLGLLFRFLWKVKPSLSPLQKSLFIFILASGYSLDILIFRHAILLYLTVLSVGLAQAIE